MLKTLAKLSNFKKYKLLEFYLTYLMTTVDPVTYMLNYRVYGIHSLLGQSLFLSKQNLLPFFLSIFHLQ